MSALVTGTLATLAAKVGADLVKNMLEKKLGPSLGGLSGTVVDMIAKKAGVSIDEIETTDPAILTNAIIEAEVEAPELINAYVDGQRESNRLMLAEMEKSKSTWTWAWRPAWMWFLMFSWAWELQIVKVVNAAVGANIPSVDLTVLMAVTATYSTYYLGGHTVKNLWGKGE